MILHTSSGVTGGGQGAECPPETSDGEISADLLGKKRQGKRERGENWEEKKENCKREGGILKIFFFFFFFFFCFSRVKTSKICFGSTKMEIFYGGKKHFTRGKKLGKMTLPPQKNFPVTPLHTSLKETRNF